MLGASQGDFPRLIVAPYDALDAFNTMAEVFNLTDKLHCPALVLSDLLISEGTFSVDPDKINMQPKIDRGKLIREGSSNGNEYKRYLSTEDGVAPRAIPGLEGYIHVVSTDEHDEDGILISDEFTNPHKRRDSVERRARKMEGLENEVPAPELEGPADADVTLIGFGSTIGVIREACEQLRDQGVSVNHLQVKWIVPFHAEVISNVINNAKRSIIVENNYSGQFYRYLRSETGLDVDGHVRKYDGEPFMPHHIVGGVQEQLAGKTTHSVPYQEDHGLRGDIHGRRNDYH